MHGSALVFMVFFWALVLGLVVFVFCRLYCPGTQLSNTPLQREIDFEEEPEEVT
jgi:hypothetical protein